MTEAKNSVAKWLEIAAHIGIVVGLLLVAFQIAQEDDIAETELRGHLFSNVTAYYEQFTGENPAISLARAIDDPRTLTTEDHVVLFNVYMAEFAKAMRQETLVTICASIVYSFRARTGAAWAGTRKPDSHPDSGRSRHVA